jgi:phage terminase small subunit
MALTGKKRIFADAVLAGRSNRDAAIAAGYSAKTASAAGSRLVKDAQVIEYIKERRKAGRKAPSAAAAKTVEEAPKAKPKFDLATALSHSDPKAFLLAAMNDIELEPRQRIEAAKTLMPFMHQKLGEGGKKDAAADAAKKAAGGKFAAPAGPRLAVNNAK